MKSFFTTFRNKSNTKAFWSETFGLLGIKSVHSQPDSPSSLLVYWSYEREIPMQFCLKVQKCMPSQVQKVKFANNYTHRQNRSLLYCTLSSGLITTT